MHGHVWGNITYSPGASADRPGHQVAHTGAQDLTAEPAYRTARRGAHKGTGREALANGRQHQFPWQWDRFRTLLRRCTNRRGRVNMAARVSTRHPAAWAAKVPSGDGCSYQ